MTTRDETCSQCNDAPATRFYNHPWDQGEMGVCEECDPWDEHRSGCNGRHAGNPIPGVTDLYLSHSYGSAYTTARTARS